jgi:aminopeptidase-like protein
VETDQRTSQGGRIVRSALELIRRLSPLRLAPNSAGADECARILCEELPFLVHEFEGGSEVNGWICPMKWEVVEARITDSHGRLVYDGMWHPLAVIGYSQPFTGRVAGRELRNHLFFPDTFDDALVYHCDLFYKPFRKEWGFSVTKQLFDSIRDDDAYDVMLRTEFQPGTMKVLEYVLAGENEDSIVLNAHNCHPYLCNDDLAGMVVGIEVCRMLERLPRRRFTYRLVIGPEHFGSIFYLSRLSDAEAGRLKCGVFLEMLGAGGGLALQRSFLGDALIDRAFLNALQFGRVDWRTDLFRKVVGNDETCWEGAGYDIPFPSLSRSMGAGHYPEYHTSRDGPEFIKPALLDESIRIVLEALHIMENDSVMTRRFKGLVALSHPRYDLYKAFYDPSEPGRKTISAADVSWNYLMDCIPRYFDGVTRVLEIAERHALPFRAVYDYVRQFEAKGLVEVKPAPGGNPSVRALSPR